VGRSSAGAAVSVERFFQFSLWGLVTSGYLAVAGTGYLDKATVVLMAGALGLRALVIAGAVQLNLSERWLTAATLAYVGFFPIDYLWISADFLRATIHLVFFLATTKVLAAKTSRDHLYTAIISFLELLAAAILSVDLAFFLFLALYLLFAMAAFTSAEIRRSLDGRHIVARAGLRRFPLRLSVLTAFVTAGILVLTAGLFFMLPRTAEAALQHLVSNRLLLPGFSNQVVLGQIGEIKTSSRPIMHVLFYNRTIPPNLKWRGAALTDFDGRRWLGPQGEDREVPVDNGRVQLISESERITRGWFKLNYHVDLNATDTDALFFAGEPEIIEQFRQPRLLRTPTDGFRLGRVPGRNIQYDANAVLEENLPPGLASHALTAEMRRRYLQLPKLDSRIRDLALAMTAESVGPAEQARAIENRLRRDYSYTLQLPPEEVADPLAFFLFERRKGHCEYFASAMTVMLRTLGIPARLVNGFQSGIRNPLTGLYVIRAADAHSWVEAWLPERGWTTFDPTPPDPNARQASIWMKLALYLDAAETFWQEWVVSYDLGRQAVLADRMERSGKSLGLRWIDRLVEVRLVWVSRLEHWIEAYGLLVLGAAFCAVLLFWLTPRLSRIVRIWQRVRRVRRGQASVADATLLYERMLELVRRRGYEKPAWFTPHEFASTLPPSELRTLIAQFTASYNALRFGGRLEAAERLPALLDRLERQEL